MFSGILGLLAVVVPNATASEAPTLPTRPLNVGAIGYVRSVEGKVSLARQVGVEGRTSGQLSTKDTLMPVMDSDGFAFDGDKSNITVKFFSQTHAQTFDLAHTFKPPAEGPAPRRAVPGHFEIKTKRAGSSRKGPGSIIAPKDKHVVRADTAYIKWNPTDGPVTISVFGHGNKELFKKTVDGQVGELQSEYLRKQLTTLLKDDQNVGFTVVMNSDKGTKSSGARLLSRQQVTKLATQLSEIEKLESTDRMLARIDAYDGVDLLNDAADAALSLWESMPQSESALFTAQHFVAQTEDDALADVLDKAEKKIQDTVNTNRKLPDVRQLLEVGNEIVAANRDYAAGNKAVGLNQSRRALADCIGDDPVLGLYTASIQLQIGFNETDERNGRATFKAAAEGYRAALKARESNSMLNLAIIQADKQLEGDFGWACNIESVPVLMRMFEFEDELGIAPSPPEMVGLLRSMRSEVDQSNASVKAFYFHVLATALLQNGEIKAAWEESCTALKTIQADDRNPPYIRAFSGLLCFRILTEMGPDYRDEALASLDSVTFSDPNVLDREFARQFMEHIHKETARPVKVPIDVPDTLVRPQGSDVALVVGISHYKDGWKLLPNAKTEALAVEKVLKSKFGFRIRELIDCEAITFKKTVQEELLKLKEGSQLLIYIAGHGDTSDIGGPFLAFTDTDPLETRFDPLHRAYLKGLVNALSMKPGGQVLLVLDTCYSAKLIEAVHNGFDRSPSRSDVRDSTSVAEILSEPCRRFICAGIDVSDGSSGSVSPFGEAFLASLENPPADRGYWKIADVFSTLLDAHRRNRLPSEPVEGSFGVGLGGFVFVPKKG